MRDATLTLDITCKLDAEYFAEWESLTDEIKAFWEDESCNCEGSGVIGFWCHGCPFCLRFDEEIQE